MIDIEAATEKLRFQLDTHIIQRQDEQLPHEKEGEIAAISSIAVDTFSASEIVDQGLTPGQHARQLADWQNYVEGLCSSRFEELGFSFETRPRDAEEVKAIKKAVNEHPEMILLNGLRRGVKMAKQRVEREADITGAGIFRTLPNNVLNDELLEAVMSVNTANIDSGKTRLRDRIIMTGGGALAVAGVALETGFSGTGSIGASVALVAGGLAGVAGKHRYTEHAKVRQARGRLEFIRREKEIAQIIPTIDIEPAIALKKIHAKLLETEAQIEQLQLDGKHREAQELYRFGRNLDAFAFNFRFGDSGFYGNLADSIGHLIRLKESDKRLGSFSSNRKSLSAVLDYLDEVMPIADKDQVVPKDKKTGKKHWKNYLRLMTHPRCPYDTSLLNPQN